MTDGGLETELVFHDGIDLPGFAAFPLLDDPDTPRPTASLLRRLSGHRTQARRGLHRRDTHVAREPRLGVLSSATRPSSSTPSTAAAVELAEEVRTAAAADGITAVVSGCVGPRGDGYDPGDAMTPDEAERYHAVQIGTFADTTADQVTAITMTNAEEAIGIVRAAVGGGYPGGDLVHRRDRRTAADGPAAARSDRAGGRRDGRRRRLLHGQLRAPDTFRRGAGAGRPVAASTGRPARERIREEPRRTRRSRPSSMRVIRPTSPPGTPRLRDRLPAVTVLGGCCGTDARHVAAICAAWSAELGCCAWQLST